jgi:hypothetical protein
MALPVRVEQGSGLYVDNCRTIAECGKRIETCDSVVVDCHMCTVSAWDVEIRFRLAVG